MIAFQLIHRLKNGDSYGEMIVNSSNHFLFGITDILLAASKAP